MSCIYRLADRLARWVESGQFRRALEHAEANQ